MQVPPPVSTAPQLIQPRSIEFYLYTSIDDGYLDVVQVESDQYGPFWICFRVTALEMIKLMKPLSEVMSPGDPAKVLSNWLQLLKDPGVMVDVRYSLGLDTRPR